MAQGHCISLRPLCGAPLPSDGSRVDVIGERTYCDAKPKRRDARTRSMTTRELNDFLTLTGPGTPMGNLFRRYWIPALMSSELPEPDCPPVRLKLLSERLIAFRDTQGRVGLMDEFCAHRGVSLWFGAQRGQRPALPLSRLEIRRDRAMHRRAVGADRVGLLRQDQAQVLRVRRARRRDLGLYGSGRTEAAAAGFRVVQRAACIALHFQAHAGMQLAAGDGRRHRLRARVVPAPLRPEKRFAACQQGRRAYCQDRRRLRGDRDRRRHGDRRAPSGTGRPLLLAHHAMDHAVPHHDPALRRQRAQRPCVGADRRRELLVVVLHPPSDARADRSREPRHAQRRRHPRRVSSRARSVR